MQKIKLVMTGGHAGSTAFAMIEEIKLQNPQWEIYFIGGKSPVEGKKLKTLAYINLKDSDVKYFSIDSGRLQRRFTIWTIPSLLKIPFGIVQSFLLLRKINPNVVLSFGGYTAFPVAFCSWLMGIPVVIHEQTAVAGRANIYSSFFAKKVALARSDSKKYFNDRKCVVVGNPISKGVLSIKPKNLKHKLPRILIHGGSSGSITLNNLISNILEKLLLNYKVIHQTGEFEYSKYKVRKEMLPDILKKNYEVYGIIKSLDWYKYLDEIDILISRSGANIVSEIMYAKIPSILIPIPFSYLDEQRVEANIAVNYGVAKLIDQDKALPEILLKSIEDIDKNWNMIVSRVAQKISPDVFASNNLLRVIKSVL